MAAAGGGTGAGGAGGAGGAAGPEPGATPASARNSLPEPRASTHPGKHNFLIWRVLFEVRLAGRPSPAQPYC